MSKLYEVEFTIRAVVVADDLAGAMAVANSDGRDIARNDELDDWDIGREIRSAAELPYGWDGRCVPFGGDGNTRIEDYLANLPPPRDTKTIDMFKVPE